MKMKVSLPNIWSVAALPIFLINWTFGFGIIQYPLGVPRPLISALWSTVHFTAYVNFVRMANFSDIAEIQGSAIAANNFRIITYCCVVFVASSMCLAHFGTKIVQRIFVHITAIDVRLKSLGGPEDSQLIFKSHMVYISATFAWIFAIAVMDFKYLGFDFPSETSRLGFFMSFHYFSVFAFVVDGSFVARIKYAGRRFRILNALLVEQNLQERSEAVAALLDDGSSHYSSVIHEIHGNNPPSIRAANKQWQLHIIRETRKIHLALSKRTSELNRVFGIQILLSMALTFCLITTLLYTCWILSTSNNTISNHWLDDIIVLMWTMFYIAKMLLIIDACETTTYEANRTGKLLTKFLTTRVCDGDIRDELLQNPLIFTANGFFRLNYSLVRGIVGSVTTYLVIMIQMRSIYEPEDLIVSKSEPTILTQTNSTA